MKSMSCFLLFIVVCCFYRIESITELDGILKLPYSFNINDNDGMPIFRTINGWSNNNDINNAIKLKWGNSNQPILRTINPDYNDTIGEPNGKNRVSPRMISNIIANNDEISIKANKFGINGMLWQWGQFIDHDLIETPMNSSENMRIEVPFNDVTFNEFDDIVHARSRAAPGTGNINTPRNQINTVTSFIDASMVYGSDNERAYYLRSHVDGKLKVTRHGKYTFMPLNTAGIENAGGNLRSDLFVGGDVRANEQIGLASLHILFVREHNRLCDVIKRTLNINDDELLYQYSRAIVIGIIQHITYNEFLPGLLGTQMDRFIPPYITYDININPTVNSIFSTAAFRVGHTMLNDIIPRRDMNCNNIPGYNDLSLDEAFFNTSWILNNNNHNIDTVGIILKGLTCIPANEIDTFHVNEVRDKLFNNVMGIGQVPLDLVSLNIDRGRDHGLPDYNSVRKHFNLNELTQFEGSIFDNIALLRECYNNINDIDLFVGILAEKKLDGSNLGLTISNIIGDQFKRLRDGDRFWYERYLNNDLLKYIKSITLKDIIERNTNAINIPKYSMFMNNQQPIRSINSQYNLEFKYNIESIIETSINNIVNNDLGLPTGHF